MVVLTIDAPSNNYTVYFDQPIPKPNYIRVFSCSLYNSWYNLKDGKFTLIDKEEIKKIRGFFLPGYCNIESFAENFKNAFLKFKIEIITKVYTPTGMLYLENPNPLRYDININEELAKLFDIKETIKWIRFVKKTEISINLFYPL